MTQAQMGMGGQQQYFQQQQMQQQVRGLGFRV